MLTPDPSNTLFQLAASFVNQTDRHLFLTGKAGTGKTTFLKHIKENTHKNTVVVAPTGVAAIHAGGVTIHSLLQLPLAPFVPVRDTALHHVEYQYAFNKNSIFAKVRLFREKIAMLEALDLLIIDEVSMVRCDILDAIDTVLRYYRKNPHEPFGGIQVLYIGDLFQLPPVVPANQWDILREHYSSPFFFDAHVIRQAPPLYIELKKIYRQKEQRFVDVLNRIRNNEVLDEDLNLLNSLYRHGYKREQSDNTIILTSHNYKADRINQDELANLPGPLHTFEATITGDFSEHTFPADRTLHLKEGAHVMFLKNDSEKRYYNGLLGVVKNIHDDAIIIWLPGDEKELMLEKEVWKNIRYTFKSESNRIEEEETGSFAQYPIKLAWAVTIHKSQGLTFDRIVIDAGASFAPGQVYVALSRCTTLDGIVLQSPIHHRSIKTDERVIAFSKEEAEADMLKKILPGEQMISLQKNLIRSFNLDAIHENITQLLATVPGKKIPGKKEAIILFEALLKKITEQQAITERFRKQLDSLFHQAKENGNFQPIEERINAAVAYFTSIAEKELLQPVNEHINQTRNKKKVRKYVKSVTELATLIEYCIKRIPRAKELFQHSNKSQYA